MTRNGCLFNLIGLRASLVIRPEKLFIKQGHNGAFKCFSSHPKAASWLLRPYGKTTDILLITNGTRDPIWTNKMYVDTAVNILNVYNVSMFDSGSYRCIDNVSPGATASAELIALGRYAKTSHKIIVKFCDHYVYLHYTIITS